MTLRNRIFDLLPALLVFIAVSAFTTYVAVAYVVQDPWWMRTMAEHAQRQQGQPQEGSSLRRASPPDPGRR
jgi:hypothetical protein